MRFWNLHKIVGTAKWSERIQVQKDKQYIFSHMQICRSYLLTLHVWVQTEAENLESAHEEEENVAFREINEDCSKRRDMNIVGRQWGRNA